MPKSKKAVEVKTPKQARLPNMEDPKIEELEALAETYAQVRDDRMALEQRRSGPEGPTPRRDEEAQKDHLPPQRNRHQGGG
jgi:hypothetical protein